MILVGNQRGGARELAVHLLKEENDHIQIHELRGFVARDLAGALNEAYAVSRGTRCKRYLFSLSLNPPPLANVRTPVFEEAIDLIEKRLGLAGQPRAIVFHEKQGRRHAHCVWSRIRAADMKAVQMSFTNNRLMEVARELYIEQGWTMPRGLAKTGARNPRNFTLAEWQQTKRRAIDPRAIKAELQDSWAISDTANGFKLALEERGYSLAIGDSRAFVAVDTHGEVYSLPRWLDLKTKFVRSRLESLTELPMVTEAKESIAVAMQATLGGMRTELLIEVARQNRRLRSLLQTALAEQRIARKKLEEIQDQRHWREVRERQCRLRGGLKGLWDWARGETRRIRMLNEAEAIAAARRDTIESDELVFGQLEERRRMTSLRMEIAGEFATRSRLLGADIRRYDALRRDAAPRQTSPIPLRRKGHQR